MIDYKEAYESLLDFCRNEMHWEFFRYEFIYLDEPENARISWQNAQKIHDHLKSLGAL